MINVILVAVLVICAVPGIRMFCKRAGGAGCCGGGDSEVRVLPRDRNRAHYPYRAEITVGGMKCRNCALRVQNALNGLDGVWAKVRFNRKTAELLLQRDDCAPALSAAVAAAGYTADSVRIAPRRS